MRIHVCVDRRKQKCAYDRTNSFFLRYSIDSFQANPICACNQADIHSLIAKALQQILPDFSRHLEQNIYHNFLRLLTPYILHAPRVRPILILFWLSSRVTNILGPLRDGTYSILKSLSVHVRLHPVYSALLLQVHELLERNVCVEKCDVALLAKCLQYV